MRIIILVLKDETRGVQDDWCQITVCTSLCMYKRAANLGHVHSAERWRVSRALIFLHWKPVYLNVGLHSQGGCLPWQALILVFQSSSLGVLWEPTGTSGFLEIEQKRELWGGKLSSLSLSKHLWPGSSLQMHWKISRNQPHTVTRNARQTSPPLPPSLPFVVIFFFKS